MSELHIMNTYGAILGMDAMCDGTIPDDLRVGDVVVLEGQPVGAIRLTVGALDAHRTEDGRVSHVVGIGLKGDGASLVKVGDVLTKELEEVDADTVCGGTEAE